MSYVPTYEVVISEESPDGTYKLLFSVGIGSKVVEEAYAIIEAGIPEAKKIDFQWGYNVDVYFDAEGFANFTNRHFRKYHNFFRDRIGDGKTYLLCVVDMS